MRLSPSGTNSVCWTITISAAEGACQRGQLLSILLPDRIHQVLQVREVLSFRLDIVPIVKPAASLEAISAGNAPDDCVSGVTANLHENEEHHLRHVLHLCALNRQLSEPVRAVNPDMSALCVSLKTNCTKQVLKKVIMPLPAFKRLQQDMYL